MTQHRHPRPAGTAPHRHPYTATTNRPARTLRTTNRPSGTVRALRGTLLAALAAAGLAVSGLVLAAPASAVPAAAPHAPAKPCPAGTYWEPHNKVCVPMSPPVKWT